MILALQLIAQATVPLTKASGVRVLFAQISGDLLLDVLIGALLAVASYSSLAVVLLVASLAATNIVPAHVALPVVLGANLGSGLLALLTTWKADPVARRVPLGNFVFKAAAVALAIVALPFATPYLLKLHSDPKQLVVYFHLLFNALMALTFIGFTDRVARLTEKWLPALREADTLGQPRHLDPVALDTPALALGNAAREAIRLADTVQEMLAGLLEVLRRDNAQLAESLRRKDDEIDRLYSAIKKYLAQISREALEARESRRWTEIIQFTINMEHVGDIIERLLLDVAER
jgi:phosphate:Na+ symporter